MAPRPPGPHLAASQATDAFFAYGKVHDWLARYPRKSWVWQTTYDPKGAAWKCFVSSVEVTPSARAIADKMRLAMGNPPVSMWEATAGRDELRGGTAKHHAA